MGKREVQQRGQVLVLALVLVAVLGLAWSRYFSVGQLLGAKARQVHGLDAAAYSGALVQAQTLNFIAFLNRAQLAHQIAMAHLVTLGSWAHFGGTEAKRLLRGNPPAHLIAMQFGPRHGQAYMAASRAAGFEELVKQGGSLRQAYSAHESFIHETSRSLSLNLVQSLPAVRLAAINAVLRAHYPELRESDLVVKVFEDTWPELLTLRRQADAELLALTTSLVKNYDFLSPRNYEAKNNWPVSSRCPALRHKLRRRGSSSMDESGRWSAADTLSLHALRANRWIGCYYREYPMAWAWIPARQGMAMAQEHVDDAPGDFSQQDFWRWVKAATNWSLLQGQDNPLANSYAKRDQQAWPSRGLASYFDIKRPDTNGISGFGLTLTIKQKSGQEIHTQSAAETFFARADRRIDGKYELANLFHPYWHARLSASIARF